jgi:oligopeptide transport system substrate-binding protein
VLLAGVLAGCSVGEDAGPPAAPPDQQELRFSFLTDPASLDPNLIQLLTETSVANQLFRGLLWYGDEDLELVPMAAKEVPSPKNGGISRDGLVYTFKLRDGLKWSDGKPLTAYDFEYSLLRLLDPATKSNTASTFFVIQGAEAYRTAKPETDAAGLSRLRDAVGVDARDAQTLVVTLLSPRATFLHLMALPYIGPVRQDVVEAHGAVWTDPSTFVGTGPFVLSERVAGERIVLRPNPNWWGDEPRLQKITIRIISQPTDAFSAYRADELDIVSVPSLPPDTLQFVSDDPQLRQQNVRVPQLSSTMILFNNKRAPFDNIKVRQAFSMALDRDDLIAFQRGAAQVLLSWIPAGMPGYDKDAGAQWKLNPEKARSLLSEAGYPGGNGLPEITFFYLAAQQGLAESLQRQLAENLGVNISIVLSKTARLDTDPPGLLGTRDRLANGEYQMLSYGFGADYPEPDNFLREPFGCESYQADVCITPSSANRSNYARPEFDQLMQQALKELDEDRRLDQYRRAQDILIDSAPVIFYGQVVRNALVNSRVAGLVATPLDGELLGGRFLERAYIASR